MKSKALRLLAVATLVLLSADAFADGRRGRGGRSGGARYNRHHVSAYIPVYAPVHRSAYYDDYQGAYYDDYRYYDRYVSYAPRTRREPKRLVKPEEP